MSRVLQALLLVVLLRIPALHQVQPNASPQSAISADDSLARPRGETSHRIVLRGRNGSVRPVSKTAGAALLGRIDVTPIDGFEGSVSSGLLFPVSRRSTADQARAPPLTFSN